MNRRTSLGYVVLVAAIVLGTSLPVGAVSNSPPADPSLFGISGASHGPDSTNNPSTVHVTVGRQLATVISLTSDEVQTDFENTAFRVSVDVDDDESKAEAIADRAEELHERADRIHEDYEEATEAYREGELSRSEYARQLATLNARANNVLSSYETLESTAANVSALELRAAGLNESALEQSLSRLERVEGTGPTELLRLFIGNSQGSISLETENGLEIEIENEDGERSREIDRERDDNDSITVDQTRALSTARAALSEPSNGSWTLTRSSIHHVSGFYRFQFALTGGEATGEAEVRIDGSSGEIFRLEEEIEAREDDGEDEEDESEEEEPDVGDDEEEGDGDDRAEETEGELAIVVSDGVASPNSSIELSVLHDGEPASNTSITINGQSVGVTDGDGTLSITLPETDEIEISARKGEAEGELEFEFEENEREREDEVFRHLSIGARLTNGVVTVVVSYDGEGVKNATVDVDDTTVGITDADGEVTFELDQNLTEDVEVEVRKGEFEAESSFSITNGSLSQSEDPHEAEDDRDEDDDEREDEEEQDDENDREDDEDEREDDEEEDDNEPEEDEDEQDDENDREDDEDEREDDEEEDDNEPEEDEDDEEEDDEDDST